MMRNFFTIVAFCNGTTAFFLIHHNGWASAVNGGIMALLAIAWKPTTKEPQ